MPLNAFDLHDQVALITGPAKGMGRAVTLTLAEAGADLVLVGRDIEEINKVAQEAQRLGRNTSVIKCDVTSPEEVTAMIDKAKKTLPHISILVNIERVSTTITTLRSSIHPYLTVSTSRIFN